MGNSLGGKRTAKVMKINGETMKYKKPVNAGEIVKDFPGHVLLDSESVKHFGIRAKPLEPQQELKPKRLYFLIELPKFPEEKVTRRVRSGIQMSAKDRLESLMLARRSVSDLSIMKSSPNIVLEETKEISQDGVTRLRMRLPKAEVERLMMQSKDEGEAAEKIMDLCISNKLNNGYGASNNVPQGALLHHKSSWNADHGMVRSAMRSREKRVGFLPISEGEIQLAVAS